jgi:hypothetical protein
LLVLAWAPGALGKQPPTRTSTMGTAKTVVPSRLTPGEYFWHPELSP